MSQQFDSLVPKGFRLKRESKDRIINAARILNSVCDGARKNDHAGFNKGDSDWFKFRLDVWSDIRSDEVVCQMFQKLRLYKEQLSRHDINYDNLMPDFEEIAKVTITTVHPSWNKVKVNFGQYKGQTWGQLATQNKGYIEWIASSFTDGDIKTIANKILANESLENEVIESEIISVDIRNDELIVKVPFDRKDELKQVIPVRTFDKSTKEWITKLMYIDAVIDTFPEAVLSPSVKEFVGKRNELKTLAHAMQSSVQYNLGEFGNGKKLMPFQMAGLHFMELGNGRVICADEMGTGKTIMASAYLQLHKDDRLAIVVCPASVKGNWRRELNQWLAPREVIQIAEGGKPKPITGNVLIINYDILGKWALEIEAMKPKIIIFDESHRLKNRKAGRTQVARDLAKSIPKVLMLTGTPVLNRPQELYSPLNILNPRLYPDDGLTFINWARKYCGAVQTKYGWDISGATNLDLLSQELNTVMIRRTKDMVLPELPAKMRNTVVLPLSNRKEYEKQYDAFEKWLLSNRGKSESQIEAIVRIEFLKQMCAEGKLKAAIEWINDGFVETGTKVVVFATHKFVIEALEKAFTVTTTTNGIKTTKKLYVTIDGSTPQKIRDDLKEQFQNDPEILVFIGNMQAAGEGLTLTAASNVVFLELGWNPAIHNQAEDRCHRITQKDAVSCWYLLAENSIEDDFLEPMLEHKRQITEKITGDEKNLDFQLFNKFYERAQAKSVLVNETSSGEEPASAAW